MSTDPRLQAKIAWFYYVEGLTQERIARRLGLNRIRVNRILGECRESGLVQFHIDCDSVNCFELGRDLERRFGLVESLVVPSPAEETDLPKVIGHAAGEHLSQRVEPHQSLGVGWGTTLLCSLNGVPPRPIDGLSVISLVGGLTKRAARNPYEVATRFADRLGAECYYIAAPVYTATAEAKAALMAHEVLQQVFERAAKVDCALVGVGEASNHATMIKLGLVTRAELMSLRAAGAVGEILGHFLDAHGRILDHPLNERVMALHPDRLREVPRVVLASGGRRKVPIIRATVAAGYVNTLITDEATAIALLGRAEERREESRERRRQTRAAGGARAAAAKR